jgi:hypothetical protein
VGKERGKGRERESVGKESVSHCPRHFVRDVNTCHGVHIDVKVAPCTKTSRECTEITVIIMNNNDKLHVSTAMT